MGKYPHSNLHNEYSDFHWQLIKLDYKYKRLYQADIDRLWIEYDFNRKEVVAIIDIKKERDLLKEEFGFTPTEKGIYEWFEKKEAKVFIVYIKENFEKFYILPFKESDKIFILEGKKKYADWLLSLRQHVNYLNINAKIIFTKEAINKIRQKKSIENLSLFKNNNI